MEFINKIGFGIFLDWIPDANYDVKACILVVFGLIVALALKRIIVQ